MATAPMACALCLLTGAAPADLVDVAQAETRVVFDLRYATADNIAGKPLYPVARCLLRAAVAAKLSGAQTALERALPGARLLLKDCYRPMAAQRTLFATVRGTRRQGYVADPDGPRGAVHTFGAAVDLTVQDAAGHELDMGTPFDFLGPLAEPRREARFAAAGRLSPAQVQNRRILRQAMVAGGFRPIPNEWWHFDAWQGASLRQRYRPLDVPLSPTN